MKLRVVEIFRLFLNARNTPSDYGECFICSFCGFSYREVFRWGVWRIKSDRWPTPLVISQIVSRAVLPETELRIDVLSTRTAILIKVVLQALLEPKTKTLATRIPIEFLDLLQRHISLVHNSTKITIPYRVNPPLQITNISEILSFTDLLTPGIILNSRIYHDLAPVNSSRIIR
jgi:hypothetical protein